MRTLCAVGISLVGAAPAFAQAPPPSSTSYTLAWVRAEGAETCPPARVLSAEVERRLGRTVFDAAAERAFEVEVTRFGDKYRSDVFVRGPGGETLGHRTLESDEPGCGALLNATALAIALVIDPEAASREPPPPLSVASFEPPRPPPVASPPPSSGPVPPLPPAPPPSVAPVTPAPPAALTLSLRGSLQLGLVPGAAPGVAMAFSLRSARRWGFLAHAEYTPSRNVARGIGSLDIGLTRAGALATFQVLRAKRVHWLLAAGPSVGAFHIAVREPTPVTAPGDYAFAAVQLGNVLQVHVTDALFVELGADALVALVRPEFVVRQQQDPVWSQPRVSASLFGGVGALFP
jgi:hypothetical protein